MRVSEQLATLLGCSVEELRADLRRLISEPARPLTREQHAELDRRGIDLVPGAARRKCTAIVGDGNACERARGHSGLHVHIGSAWEGLHAFAGRARCPGVCTLPMAVTQLTTRCVLELGHESAHQLDDGAVFT